MALVLEMQKFTFHNLTDLFRSFATRMADERAFLAELDGEIGDADHGAAMSEGFAVAAKALFDVDAKEHTLAQGFALAANSFLNAVGATTGPLYAGALHRAGERFGTETEIPFSRLPEMVIAMFEGIEARGHGRPGDKTMIDAWSPAAHIVRDGLGSGTDTKQLLRSAARAAANGAEATRAMMATKGRAARLGPRSIGHLDPGAVSAAALLDVLAHWAERSYGEGQ